jgi:hypothetical protein
MREDMAKMRATVNVVRFDVFTAVTMKNVASGI